MNCGKRPLVLPKDVILIELLEKVGTRKGGRRCKL